MQTYIKGLYCRFFGGHTIDTTLKQKSHIYVCTKCGKMINVPPGWEPKTKKL